MLAQTALGYRSGGVLVKRLSIGIDLLGKGINREVIHRRKLCSSCE